MAESLPWYVRGTRLGSWYALLQELSPQDFTISAQEDLRSAVAAERPQTPSSCAPTHSRRPRCPALPRPSPGSAGDVDETLVRRDIRRTSTGSPPSAPTAATSPWDASQPAEPGPRADRPSGLRRNLPSVWERAALSAGRPGSVCHSEASRGATRLDTPTSVDPGRTARLRCAPRSSRLARPSGCTRLPGSGIRTMTDDRPNTPPVNGSARTQPPVARVDSQVDLARSI